MAALSTAVGQLHAEGGGGGWRAARPQNIRSLELKKAEIAALSTAVGQLHAEGGWRAARPQNCHTCTVPTSVRAPALLITNADE